MRRRREVILSRKKLVEEARKKGNELKREKEIKEQKLLKPWSVSEKVKLDYQINARARCAKNMFNPLIHNLKIAIYTSLSPSHHNKDSQLMAVESWHKMGLPIYSFNHTSEIDILKKIYPDYVKFVNAIKTTNHIFGKPCIIINEMIDHFYDRSTGDILMLINSDIIINSTVQLLDKIKCMSEVGIIISSRNDFKEDVKDYKKYSFGFDVFFIHKKFVHIFPCSMYSMGQTWWDYWLPFTALKNKTPIFRIEEAFAFHREHPKQYNDKDWHRMTAYFRLENDISETNPQIINDGIWNDIMNNSITI